MRLKREVNSMFGSTAAGLKILTKTSIMAAICTALVSTPVMAGSAKGKPFVALQDQIVEVQGAISTLEEQVAELRGDVDSLESRVSANEQLIIDLGDENDHLALLISGAYTSISDINTEIQYLSQDVVTNAGLISSLQAALAAVETGQIELSENLQDQIDTNLELIGYLQDDIDDINEYLEMDQHISEGTCPEGQYVIGHTADSVSCAPVDAGGTANIIGYFTFARSEPWGRNAQAYCYLPTDIRTGGGFNAIQTDHSVRRSTPTGVNGWTVESVGNERDIQAYVMCLRVN